MNNVAKARRIAATARDVLGGNGILLDYRVMEHTWLISRASTPTRAPTT
jgi:glutaryl-CoA dehydrogenase